MPERVVSSFRHEFLKRVPGLFDRGWRKAPDYTLPLNAFTLQCSERNTDLAGFTDILKQSMRHRKFRLFMSPWEYLSCRIRGFPVMPVPHRWPMLRHRIVETVEMESETSRVIFLGVPISSGRNHGTMRRYSRENRSGRSPR
jgi:hypothetical protein